MKSQHKRNIRNRADATGTPSAPMAAGIVEVWMLMNHCGFTRRRSGISALPRPRGMELLQAGRRRGSARSRPCLEGRPRATRRGLLQQAALPQAVEVEGGRRWHRGSNPLAEGVRPPMGGGPTPCRGWSHPLRERTGDLRERTGSVPERTGGVPHRVSSLRRRTAGAGEGVGPLPRTNQFAAGANSRPPGANRFAARANRRPRRTNRPPPGTEPVRSADPAVCAGRGWKGLQARGEAGNRAADQWPGAVPAACSRTG